MTNEIMKPGGNIMDGLGAVDNTDKFGSSNYARLLNKSSKAVEDGEGEPGQILDSEGNILNGKKFLPVFKYNSFLEFNSEKDGLGLKRRSFNADEEWVKRGLEWVGKEKPVVTKVINIISVFGSDFDKPVVLSFRSTSIKTARKIITAAEKSGALYLQLFELDSRKEETKGYTYYVFTAKPVEGKISKPHVDKAKKMFTKCAEDYVRMASSSAAESFNPEDFETKEEPNPRMKKNGKKNGKKTAAKAEEAKPW